ncbi:TetR/AcrR family transcriptional regulator [uncultured Acetobacteroides sp.]|uniref:TetR/AcrR family transcriptional regulator n=1 Tax=uncultured Acetobacteroides sp. TaxID=1760811 RepID=UPI0029F4D842|nr:TetR/AcrR family transcriptional regulator [uncultured Acetobacteroides sp.]
MREVATAAKDDQREIIIKAATDVFAKYGYKKATLESIGQSIGKVKSFVYYYFRNKEELFEAVIDNEVDQLRSRFEQIHTSDAPACQKMEEYAKRRMSLIFQLANYFSLISNGVLINPSLTDKLRRKYDEKEVGHIKMILGQGMEAGEFRIKDVELASLALFTVLKGLEIPLFTSNESQTNIDKRIDDLLAIIFNGIRSK